MMFFPRGFGGDYVVYGTEDNMLSPPPPRSRAYLIRRHIRFQRKVGVLLQDFDTIAVETYE